MPAEFMTTKANHGQTKDDEDGQGEPSAQLP